MKPMDIITKEYLRKDIPVFSVGDTINVETKIIEGEKEKLQDFKGIVIAKRGGGLSETFVVRKISYGEGIERTFLIHSPRINKIDVLKKGRVRRAKLYYLREKIGKHAKVKELKKAVVVPEEGVVKEEETRPTAVPERPAETKDS